jgi:hypothetical protein
MVIAYALPFTTMVSQPKAFTILFMFTCTSSCNVDAVRCVEQGSNCLSNPAARKLTTDDR